MVTQIQLQQLLLHSHSSGSGCFGGSRSGYHLKHHRKRCDCGEAPRSSSRGSDQHSPVQKSPLHHKHRAGAAAPLPPDEQGEAHLPLRLLRAEIQGNKSLIHEKRAAGNDSSFCMSFVEFSQVRSQDRPANASLTRRTLPPASQPWRSPQRPLQGLQGPESRTG